jgi:hypothetical protein
MSSLYYSGDTGTNRGTSLRRPGDACRRAQIRSDVLRQAAEDLAAEEQAQVKRYDLLYRNIIPLQGCLVELQAIRTLRGPCEFEGRERSPPRKGRVIQTGSIASALIWARLKGMFMQEEGGGNGDKMTLITSVTPNSTHTVCRWLNTGRE